MKIASILHCIILQSLVRPTLPRSLHYVINGTIFGKFIEQIIRVSIVSTTLSETFLIVRRIQRDIFMEVHRSSCHTSVIHFRF
jgi:uncharacterized membrane protein YdjX (TVP38/TMEM64 family)